MEKIASLGLTKTPYTFLKAPEGKITLLALAIILAAAALAFHFTGGNPLTSICMGSVAGGLVLILFVTSLLERVTTAPPPTLRKPSPKTSAPPSAVTDPTLIVFNDHLRRLEIIGAQSFHDRQRNSSLLLGARHALLDIVRENPELAKHPQFRITKTGFEELLKTLSLLKKECIFLKTLLQSNHVDPKWTFSSDKYRKHNYTHQSFPKETGLTLLHLISEFTGYCFTLFQETREEHPDITDEDLFQRKMRGILSQRRRELMEIVVARGVDVNAKTSYGFTALHISVSLFDNDPCTQFLLENWADPSLQDKWWGTPFFHAVHSFYEEHRYREPPLKNYEEVPILLDTLLLLKSYGADPSYKTTSQNYPAHMPDRTIHIYTLDFQVFPCDFGKEFEKEFPVKP